MKTVKEILFDTKKRLRENGDETWGIDADLLVMRALGLTRMQLVTRDTDEVPDKAAAKLENLLQKRLSNMPMQYILENCEFMGINFKVNENVLIPRPDTEVLVEEVLKRKPQSALDIGTGSGAIAVSLAKYGVKSVTACDISQNALDVAKENAKNADVDIDFIKSDIFKNISGKFDAIVSNPPYIVSDVIPTLMPQVKDYEPRLALDGGKDGLDFYRSITAQAKEHLNKGGLLAFEIGYDQGETVSKLMRENGFENVKVIKDLAGLDRVVTGTLN
ncbi:MAG: peptide chain release factor N(5)-glutamine methyltransferase [Firmicutes bacterium]|nr:peptide chain release factor N(5)-glutamine methyltransferase [Bacillota bacterium]